MTVALLADKGIVNGGPAPLVLVISWTALVALLATRIVLTTARHFVRVVGRALVALRGVPVAHTFTANMYILNAVKVL